MADRLYTTIQKEQVGDFYQGRPVINTGTEIDGGVYIYDPENSDMEAPVIDIDEYGSGPGTRIPELYGDVTRSVIADNGSLEETDGHEFASAVFDAVCAQMEYDMSHTEDIMEHHGTRKVDIQGNYVAEGKGVCRHMALVSAAIMERAYRDGVVDGTGIINENLDGKGNGHMWAEYVEESGKRYVVDPAQNYEGGPDPNANWDYHPQMSVKEIGPELLEPQ